MGSKNTFVILALMFTAMQSTVHGELRGILVEPLDPKDTETKPPKRPAKAPATCAQVLKDKKWFENRTNSPKTIVHLCSQYDPEIYESCWSVRDYVNDSDRCPGKKEGLKILPLDIDDCSPEEISKIVSKLPDGTPIIADMHGVMAPSEIRRKQDATNPLVHYLPVPPNKGKFGKLKIKMSPDAPAVVGDFIESRAYVDALKNKNSNFWFSTCFSEGACRPGDNQCKTGAACKKEESSFSSGSDPEKTAGEIVKLLCNPKHPIWKQANSNGILSPSKIGKHFCNEFGGAILEALPVVVTTDRNWKSPVESMTEITKVSNFEALSEKYDRLKDKHAQKAVVTKTKIGTTYRFTFENDDGETQEEAWQLASDDDPLGQMKTEYPGWPKDCSENGVQRKNCNLTKNGELYSIEAREKSGSCIGNAFLNYTPVPNKFELKYPYGSPPMPGLPHGEPIASPPTH